MKSVFISYAKEDYRFARDLVNDLSDAQDLDVWFNVDRLLPGQDWAAEIRDAIARADFFVLLLSTISISKVGFVQSELHHALEYQTRRPHGVPFILPIRVDPCDVNHPDLAKLHYVDYYCDRRGSINSLFRTFGVVRKPAPTQKFFRELDAAVQELVKEGSDVIRRNAELIEERRELYERTLPLLEEARALESGAGSNRDSAHNALSEEYEQIWQFQSPDADLAEIGEQKAYLRSLTNLLLKMSSDLSRP